MSIEVTWRRWTCDWCGARLDMEGASQAPPFGWIVNPEGLRHLDAQHLCSKACEQKLFDVDRLAGELSRSVVRIVGKAWRGKFPPTTTAYENTRVVVYHNGQAHEEPR